jgi:transposase-like protein
MLHELKQKAIQLRQQQQLSYGAIRKQIPVAKSTLSVWLRPYPLSKEKISELRRMAWKASEAKIERFRLKMREKRESEDQIFYEKYLKKFGRIDERSFFVAGLMLYIAEGTKRAPAKLALANTDPRVQRVFIRWLEKFFHIHRGDLRVHLQLYQTMDVEKEIKIWQNKLSLGRSQFYKPFIRKLTPASFSYQESFRHGTASVMVFGSKIQREVSMAMKALLDTLF